MKYRIKDDHCSEFFAKNQNMDGISLGTDCIRSDIKETVETQFKKCLETELSIENNLVKVCCYKIVKTWKIM